MKDLSIIIPFAGEYPQAIFTVQAIAQSLLGKIEFEIIVIDNYCKELKDQLTASKQTHSMVNKSAEAFKSSERGNEWLRYMKFDERLSHWECKRLACEVADSDTFLFIDAHCIPSMGIEKMFFEYVDEGYSELGTFHMPLTYKILEWRKLIYKMVVEDDFYGYSFTGFRESDFPYTVPCMSTCGMMISRKVYDKVGGWPKRMQAYGGGENFINYAMGVCGLDKFIYPHVTLHHHGEKRDYHSTYNGTLMNRMIAHYLFGGSVALNAMAQSQRGNEKVLKSMVESIVHNQDHRKQRLTIKSNSSMSLQDFVESWRG